MTNAEEYGMIDSVSIIMPLDDPFSFTFEEEIIRKGGDREETPANGTRFSGRGVRFGHDRPGMAGSHGDGPSDWPVKPLPKTKG